MPPRLTPCKQPGCSALLRVNLKRGGYCRAHADWSERAARLREYNQTVKKKPPGTKYKTERLRQIPRTCIICGVDFLATLNAVRKQHRNGGVICSRRCQGVRAAMLTPKQDTSIERSIEAALIHRGWTFKKQEPLGGVSLVDFYLPDLHAAIFCDGDYWHTLPWRVARDARQSAILTSLGCHVYRFSQAAIEANPVACLDRITPHGLPLPDGAPHQLHLPTAE